MTLTKKTLIGITGGIAVGKSTVSNILKSSGFKIIDADEISRKFMKKGNPSYQETLEYFGEEILRDDGEIDRKALGQKVFSNSKLLKVLNDITHKSIFKEIQRQIETSSEKIIFIDIPLFFEECDEILKYGIEFDEVWVVYCDRETQIERLIERNSLTKGEAIDRIDSQISIDIKKERADRVIYNLGSLDDLKLKINFLLKGLS